MPINENVISLARPLPDKEREALDQRLLAVSSRALELAQAHDGDNFVKADNDLSETTQGDLEAAAIGSLGCSPEVQERCLEALNAYQATRLARAQREHTASGGVARLRPNLP